MKTAERILTPMVYLLACLILLIFPFVMPYYVPGINITHAFLGALGTCIAFNRFLSYVTFQSIKHNHGYNTLSSFLSTLGIITVIILFFSSFALLMITAIFHNIEITDPQYHEKIKISNFLFNFNIYCIIYSIFCEFLFWNRYVVSENHTVVLNGKKLLSGESYVMFHFFHYNSSIHSNNK